MGCYLEEYWAWVGTWAPRFSWQAMPGHINSKRAGSFLRQMILCAADLATLLGLLAWNKILVLQSKARALFKCYVEGVIES